MITKDTLKSLISNQIDLKTENELYYRSNSIGRQLNISLTNSFISNHCVLKLKTYLSHHFKFTSACSNISTFFKHDNIHVRRLSS